LSRCCWSGGPAAGNVVDGVACFIGGDLSGLRGRPCCSRLMHWQTGESCGAARCIGPRGRQAIAESTRGYSWFYLACPIGHWVPVCIPGDENEDVHVSESTWSSYACARHPAGLWPRPAVGLHDAKPLPRYLLRWGVCSCCAALEGAVSGCGPKRTAPRQVRQGELRASGVRRAASVPALAHAAQSRRVRARRRHAGGGASRPITLLHLPAELLDGGWHQLLPAPVRKTTPEPGQAPFFSTRPRCQPCTCQR
jgi:hypothetical protein